MDETVFAVELEARCTPEVSQDAVAVMRAELAGLDPQIRPTQDGFQVKLQLADAPNGFFTGVEAATTSAIARLTVATGVAELDDVTYTQLRVAAQPRAHNTTESLAPERAQPGHEVQGQPR